MQRLRQRRTQCLILRLFLHLFLFPFLRLWLHLCLHLFLLSFLLSFMLLLLSRSYRWPVVFRLLLLIVTRRRGPDSVASVFKTPLCLRELP